MPRVTLHWHWVSAGSTNAGHSVRRGRSPSIKSQTEWGQESSRGRALNVITSLKQVCCLWMWNLEISAIFLAAVISSFSALTPTLFFTFCQTLWLSLTYLDSCFSVIVRHAVLNYLRQYSWCKYHKKKKTWVNKTSLKPMFYLSNTHVTNNLNIGALVTGFVRVGSQTWLTWIAPRDYSKTVCVLSVRHILLDTVTQNTLLYLFSLANSV